MISSVLKNGSFLWSVTVLTCLLFVSCEDDSQVLTERPAPPLHQAQNAGAQKSPVSGNSIPATVPDNKAKQATKQVPKTTTEGENKKAAKESVPEKVVRKTRSTDPVMAKPSTKNPADHKVYGVTKGLHLAQDLDFGWTGKNEKARVEIVTPKPNTIVRSGRLRVQLRIIGLKIGAGNKGRGNYIRLLLDNETPRDLFKSGERTVTIDGLSKGLHTIRVFATTPWGESIKAPNAYAAVNFYVKTNKDQPIPVDFSKPVMSYSKPEGIYKGQDAERILLDFHLANSLLRPGGNLVRLVLDGGPPIDLAAWSPVWLEGMAPGNHSVSLTLVDSKGKTLHGPYNQIERTFTVE